MSLLQILEDNVSYVIIENTEDISDDDPPPDPQPGEIVKVRGSLVSFIDRLDDELLLKNRLGWTAPVEFCDC